MEPELAAALAVIGDKIDALRFEIFARFETIDIKVSGVPLIAEATQDLVEATQDLRRELRMVKAAINDMARVNITAGEVEALHEELDKIANAQIDIRARLSLLGQAK
jgi:hypothetical protein